MLRSLGWLVVAGLGCLGACQPGPSSSPETTADAPLPSGVPDPEAASFAEPVESAHGLAAWREKRGFRTGIRVTLVGETRLRGELTMSTDIGRSRIELADGVTATRDGNRLWVSPPDAEFPGARAHLLSWPFWLGAAFELRDPGTYLEKLGPKTFRGETYEAAQLSFAPGVGARPRDRYVLYKDPETERLRALAPVTLPGTGPDPLGLQAITYDEYEAVQGVLVPIRGTIWSWSENEGARGDPLGTVALTDPRFIALDEDVFEAPEEADRGDAPAR